jgi:hypothetical protein
MNLRDFLEGRERELLEKIASLHSQLTPLESELAEIRRAKGAIGVAALTAMDQVLLGVPAIGSLGDALKEQRDVSSLAHLLATSSTGETPLALRMSPYTNLTMKQLVVKVLAEHFQQGATAREMLDFFRDAWGRDIERQNLSPQLSRLYQEGVVGRIRSTRGWFLYKRGDLVEGFRPYRHQARIIWCDPQATDLSYEPLMARDIEDDVAKDRMPYKRTVATTTGGTINRSVMLVWLLPHEVQGDDSPALRHEFPASDED